MKVLILGSEGFIGSNLVRSLLQKGVEVAGCDLVENHIGNYTYHKISVLSPEFDDVLTDGKFDACINAAGSGNVGYSMQHPMSDFEANTFTVARVLSSIYRNNPGCKFLQISSAAVYGNPALLPVNETHQLLPVSAYGYHKQMSEIACREYHTVFGLPVTVIRPFSVYGAGLHKQLLWDLCNKLQAADEVELFGSGNETRDFINIIDFCELLYLLLQKGNFSCGYYNAANGKAVSIRQLADIFEACYPGNKKIHFNGQQKKGDPLNWEADITQITALGYQQRVRFEEGVKDYIHWFLTRQNNA